jgi:hypothetical protein
MYLAVPYRSDFWEFCSISPTFVRDPFTFELVEPEERVWNAVEELATAMRIKHAFAYTLFAIRSRCTLVGTVFTGIQLSKSDCLNSHDSLSSCTRKA